MSNTARFFVYLILGIIGVWLVLKLLKVVLASVLGALLNLIVPLAVVAVVGLLVYNLIIKKPLGGGGRPLP